MQDEISHRLMPRAPGTRPRSSSGGLGIAGLGVQSNNVRTFRTLGYSSSRTMSPDVFIEWVWRAVSVAFYSA